MYECGSHLTSLSTNIERYIQYTASKSYNHLQVYNGTSLNSEAGIVDCPTALVSFHLDTTEPRIPALAMAAGPFVYVYKNMRPYFKFTVPSMDINPIEQDLWSQAKVCLFK